MSTNPTARHLTLEDREIIARSLAEGMIFKEIASLIQRHPATIAREIMRHKEATKIRINFSGHLEEPLGSHDGLKRTRIFYCDPGKAYQKGGIEKNHELIRYVIPKGTSLERFNQQDITLLINHINSYSRNERAPFTPFDLLETAYPELIKKLGLERIHPDDILLNPTLLRR